MEDEALPLDEYLRKLSSLPAPYLFIGDAAWMHEYTLLDSFEADAHVALPCDCSVQAGRAAFIAARSISQAISPEELLPYYLRAPQAEREYEARHAGESNG